MQFLCTNVLRFLTIRSPGVALTCFGSYAFVREATFAISDVTASARACADSRQALGGSLFFNSAQRTAGHEAGKDEDISDDDPGCGAWCRRPLQ